MLGRFLIVLFAVGIGLLAENAVAQVPDQTGGDSTEVPGLQPNASVATAQDAASLRDKASLVIGFSTVSRLLSDLQRQGVDLNEEKLAEGIQKAIKGEELGMTQEEIRTVMMAFQKTVEKQQVEKMTLMAKKNSAEGEAFLAENAKKENVKTLPSGVQYEILEEGTGATPVATNKVRVHYHGTLPDGTVFDSSLKPRNGAST